MKNTKPEVPRTHKMATGAIFSKQPTSIIQPFIVRFEPNLEHQYILQSSARNTQYRKCHAHTEWLPTPSLQNSQPQELSHLMSDSNQIWNVSTFCTAQHEKHKTGSATITQNGNRRHLCKKTNLNNSAISCPIRTKFETWVHSVQLSMENAKPEVPRPHKWTAGAVFAKQPTSISQPVIVRFEPNLKHEYILYSFAWETQNRKCHAHTKCSPALSWQNNQPL